MSNDIRCIGYQKNYYDLNLALKSSNERLFDYTLLELIIRNFNEGYVFKRILKTMRQGTKVNFERIDDTEKAKKSILGLVNTYNAKYNANASIDFGGEG